MADAERLPPLASAFGQVRFGPSDDGYQPAIVL